MRGLIALLLIAAANAQIPCPPEAVPLLLRHCAPCHAGEDPEGGLHLPQEHLDAAAWSQVVSRLRTRRMPPPDAAVALDEEARAGLIARIQVALLAHEAPPRPASRRLNRTEYRNAVRDLLGVELPMAELPQDETGYGFDTIGDVLGLSPPVLERYAELAERVAEAAIVDEDPANPPVIHLEAEGMEGTVGRILGDTWNLWSRGEITARVRLPRPGRYEVLVRGYADQAGPEIARMSIRLGPGPGVELEVPWTRRDLGTMVAGFEVAEREVDLALGFVNDYYVAARGGQRAEDRNLILDWARIRGPLDPPVLPPGQRRLFALDPGLGGFEDRARPLLEDLLPRAWRRSVTPEEVARLARLVQAEGQAGASFARAFRTALAASLLSPHFLLRPEPAGPGPGAREAWAFALASRLSFFLWSSPPDLALLQAAATGDLLEPDRLRAEAERLLEDPRADALVTDFAAQWLELRALDGVTPDPARVPDFDEGLRADLLREAELFLLDNLRGRRPVRELVAARHTFLNDRLAAHYGLPAPGGPGFARVEAPERAGLPFLGAVLTVTSNPTRTSPVKRGKWILEQLLDDAPPPPPPGVGALAEAGEAREGSTLRERLLAHRSQAECASCHARMDALGFVLEGYDLAGRIRREDAGRPLETRGELPDGLVLEGPEDLRRHLAEHPDLLRCLAKKLLTHATGRGLGAADEAIVEDILRPLDPGTATWRELVLGVVRSPAFAPPPP